MEVGAGVEVAEATTTEVEVAEVETTATDHSSDSRLDVTKQDWEMPDIAC